MIEILTWVGAALLIIGSGLTLIAALALLRFPDLLGRQHAATKPQVLGLVLMMIGMALIVRHPSLSWTAALVVSFQLVTAPVSAHMIGRASYRTGRITSDELVVDELGEDLESTQLDAPIGPGGAESD